MTPSCQELARMILARADATDANEEALVLLTDGLVRARGAWPDLEPDPAHLVEHLASRLPPGADLLRALATFHLEDLYLCCACLTGDDRAHRIFNDQYLPVVEATLAQLRLERPLREELRQRLLVDLLVGRQGAPPLLTRYGGVGRLTSWLRVVTARDGRKALQREKRMVPSDDRRLEQELIEDQVELPSLKESYRVAFKAAFKEALARLVPREATLLRCRHVDGMGLDQIGAIHRVHASTVHRWLDRIREDLLESTHQILAERLGIPEEECATIIRMIKNDMDLTLRTFFGGAPREP